MQPGPSPFPIFMGQPGPPPFFTGQSPSIMPADYRLFQITNLTLRQQDLIEELNHRVNALEQRNAPIVVHLKREEFELDSVEQAKEMLMVNLNAALQCGYSFTCRAVGVDEQINERDQVYKILLYKDSDGIIHEKIFKIDPSHVPSTPEQSPKKRKCPGAPKKPPPKRMDIEKRKELQKDEDLF